MKTCKGTAGLLIGCAMLLAISTAAPLPALAADSNSVYIDPAALGNLGKPEQAPAQQVAPLYNYHRPVTETPPRGPFPTAQQTPQQQRLQQLLKLQLQQLEVQEAQRREWAAQQAQYEQQKKDVLLGKAPSKDEKKKAAKASAPKPEAKPENIRVVSGANEEDAAESKNITPFPYKMQVRSESADPNQSFGISRPAPLPDVDEESKDKKSTRTVTTEKAPFSYSKPSTLRKLGDDTFNGSDNPEMDKAVQMPKPPDLVPSLTSASGSVEVTYSGGIPIPPRRPSKASAPHEFIAQARERREALNPIDAPGAIRVTDIEPAAGVVRIEDDIKNLIPAPTETPPGPRGKKNMPAVPKESVTAEPLDEQTIILSSVPDPLLDRVERTDEKHLLKKLVKLAGDREAVPQPEIAPTNNARVAKPGKEVIKALPLERQQSLLAARQEMDPTQFTNDDLSQTKESGIVSIPFAPRVTAIDDTIQEILESKILQTLRRNPQLMLQVQSQAGARRESLARALAIREFLMGKGIDSGRINIRMSGASDEVAMPNQIDNADLINLRIVDPAKAAPEASAKPSSSPS